MVIDAQRQPAQPHSYAISDDRKWGELVRVLAGVRTLVGDGVPDLLAVIFDPEHGWGAAADYRRRGWQDDHADWVGKYIQNSSLMGMSW